MPEPGSPRDAAAPPQVLVAEDDATSRLRLEVTLRKWGFAVAVAGDGREAWRLFEEKRPGIAILDWQMPGLDGLELCRRIKGLSSACYVVLLTARASHDDVVIGLDAGADEYIRKPFDRAELRARIRAGERIRRLQLALETRVGELERALTQVKQLSGLVPICSYCKKIRDDRDYWHQLESYISEHTDARFSHGICPHCLKGVKAELRKRGERADKA